MGASSSSISELPANEYLKKLAGNESISSNDPFWNQLLSFTFQVPKNSADQRLLEEATTSLCKNFAINNCQTGNLGALIQVFLIRATELKDSAQCEDNIFTWQTYNALFIIRNLCKYFVENLSEGVVMQQLDTTPPNVQGREEESPCVADELMNSLIEILVDVPILDFTYALHLECMNALLVLLSIQMFQPTSAHESKIYHCIMDGKCSIHACVLMKVLLKNYIAQRKCPPSLLPTSDPQHGALYKAGSAMASGLWSVMTLGLSVAKKEDEEDPPSDTLIANHSLLLILVLVNHCTKEELLYNPYREAIFSFTSSTDDSSPSPAVATFKLDLAALYKVMCDTLKDDQVTLFLYLLLHRNPHYKAFVLSRTNIDQLVAPILKILYHAQEKNSHHIYMALIILLMLSEDEEFNKHVHTIKLKNIAWFKERHIPEISLGGLLIIVLIRTIQYNMTRMKDKYLHTNCLAALANMSAYFSDLHPYVAQRLVNPISLLVSEDEMQFSSCSKAILKLLNLFGILLKKHTKLVEEIRHNALPETPSLAESGSESGLENEHIEDLSILEEVIRMVLEIINSCLTNSLHHNPNLVYTVLYQKEKFEYFKTHPTFQDIIQNIDIVLNYFVAKLDTMGPQPTVQDVQQVVAQGVVQFRRDKLKKFPELKFKYVEEEEPEEFFVPYVWSLIFHSSNLYFNPSRIQIFSIHSPDPAGDEDT